MPMLTTLPLWSLLSKLLINGLWIYILLQQSSNIFSAICQQFSTISHGISRLKLLYCLLFHIRPDSLAGSV